MIYVAFKQNQNNYLAHHGIKGQKWGVRRYQNEDGTLTALGKQRYLKDSDSYRIYNTIKDPRKLHADNGGLYIKNTNELSGNKESEEIDSASKILSAQSKIVSKNFRDYFNTVDEKARELSNDRKTINNIVSKLKQEFSSVDDINERDFDEALDEYILEHIQSRSKDANLKMVSSIKQYEENVDRITKDIVGSYGKLPLHNFVSSENMGRGKSFLLKALGAQVPGEYEKVSTTFEDAVGLTLRVNAGSYARALDRIDSWVIDSNSVRNVHDKIVDEFIKKYGK